MTENTPKGTLDEAPDIESMFFVEDSNEEPEAELEAAADDAATGAEFAVGGVLGDGLVAGDEDVCGLVVFVALLAEAVPGVGVDLYGGVERLGFGEFV